MGAIRNPTLLIGPQRHNSVYTPTYMRAVQNDLWLYEGKKVLYFANETSPSDW